MSVIVPDAAGTIPFDLVSYCAPWWPTGVEDSEASRALVELVRAKAIEARPQSRE